MLPFGIISPALRCASSYEGDADRAVYSALGCSQVKWQQHLGNELITDHLIAPKRFCTRYCINQDISLSTAQSVLFNLFFTQ